MPNPNLIIDNSCESLPLLAKWCISNFYDLSEEIIKNDAIYIVGRTQFSKHHAFIRDLVEKYNIRIVFSNPFEGSETLRNQIMARGMDDLVRTNKILVISGGDMEHGLPCLTYDHFLPKIHDFNENKQACLRSSEIYQKKYKPYSFLFLNGRARKHRKWMIEKLDHLDLLSNALCSWLDSSAGARKDLSLVVNGENLMCRPRAVCYLPWQYEVDRYRHKLSHTSNSTFAKYELFDNEWGEIYINADAYIDTYFSVVTETVHEYPYSFRTEKIWKPIAMAHPWIAVANRGFYRDMHKLGFRTWSHLIDEKFDLVDDNTLRLELVAACIQDICKQDLFEFLMASQDVCKYNQQHLLAIRDKVQGQFPERFFQFLKQHQWMT